MIFLVPGRCNDSKLTAKNFRVAMLALVAGAVFSLHLLMCASALWRGYYPTSSDEIDYVKSVKYFLLNGRPHAFSTFDELYSANGNFSFHGPIYSVIFGLPQLLLGFHSVHFILYANIILSLATIVLLVCVPRDVELRLIAAIVLISSPVFYVYATSFMMETLQVFISVAYASIFAIVLRRPVLGLMVPLLLGFTRQSNFLYSTSLFATRSSARRLTLFAIGWIAMLMLLLLEIHFFHAPFPGGKFSDVISKFGHLDVWDAGRQLFSNASDGLVQYFTRREDGFFYLIAKYVFFLATIYSTVSGCLRSDRLLIAAGFVGLAFFVALITLYDVHGWRDLRSLAGVTIFLIALLAREKRNIQFLYVVLVLQLAVFPSIVRYREDFNNQRVIPFIGKIESSEAKIAAYKKLGELPTTRNNQEFILINVEKGIFSTDMSVEYLSLPVRSRNEIPIRYTFDRNGVIGTSKADYQLTSGPCRSSTASLVTAYFFVCQKHL